MSRRLAWLASFLFVVTMIGCAPAEQAPADGVPEIPPGVSADEPAKTEGGQEAPRGRAPMPPS